MKKLTESVIIKYEIVVMFAIFLLICLLILNHLLIPFIALILAYLIIRWLSKKV